MTNPVTTHNTTTTTTTTQKPSTMDNIKDKATNLIDKVTGKSHTYTDHQGVVHQPNHALGHNNDNALNQGGVHTTGPSGATGFGYTTDPNAGSTGLAGANTAVNPTHHGGVHSTAHQQNTGHHSGPLHTGAAMAGTAVPHEASVDRAAYQQQQYNPNMAAPQHSIPAGPTGTTNIPTFAQNVPPPAGVVPAAQVAEIHDGYDNKKHSLFGGYKKDHVDHGLSAHQQVHGAATAGGNVPLNTASHQSNVPLQQQGVGTYAGVQNTVPAMGAPGTTTAAGTHIPGEYNPNAVQPGLAQGSMNSDPYRRPVT